MTWPISVRPWVVGLLVSTLNLGCGNRGSSDSLSVGSDDIDGGSFAEGDATASSALDASIEENHVTVTIVTLSCAGDCADVQVVATGGHPPYTFAWDDGSTTASRHVCPTSDASYHVKVSDTATTGEFPRAAQSVQVPLTADVLACPDGGSAEAGRGGDASDCETILTVVAGTGAVSGAGAEDCYTEAGVPVLAAPTSLQKGQEYELVENVTVTLLAGSPPAWNFYGSSGVCYLEPGGQLFGSMTQDPTMPRESICFRADADYAAIDWTYTSVAAGVGQTTYQLCHGCSTR
jgi:hypothetical protein